MKDETVEEYLARGGRIVRVPGYGGGEPLVWQDDIFAVKALKKRANAVANRQAKRAAAAAAVARRTARAVGGSGG